MSGTATSPLTQALWFGRRTIQDGFVAPDDLLEALFSYIEQNPNLWFQDYLVRLGLLTPFQNQTLQKRLEPMPTSWHRSEPGPSSILETSHSRYERKELLQQGGAGKIYRAYDVILERDVAIKCLLQLDSPETQQRFVQEYRITGQLEHPNIISVHDAGFSEDWGPFYVMRLLEGETLQEVLSRAHTQGNPGRTTLLRTFLEICAAMAHAHSRGILHRDLKPTNIMVGDLGEAQIMDWGIAQPFSPSESAESAAESSIYTPIQATSRVGASTLKRSHIAGTPGFMAPEQVLTEAALDPRSDVFSLGCILYQMLTGHLPFSGTDLEDYKQALQHSPRSPSAYDSRISQELDEITLRALAHHREERYDSVRELSTALALHLEGTKTRKLREQRALAKVAEGMEARQQLERCEAQAEHIVRGLRGEQARIRPHDPIEKKRPLWEKEKQIETLEKDAMVWLGEATSTLTQALALDPACQEAHNQLANLYQGRLLVAEQRRDTAQQAYHEAMLRRHNDGRYDEFLKQEGQVCFSSDPPQAQVALYRMEEVDRILTPQSVHYSGTTPLGPLTLPTGSYLAVLSLEGYREIRLPFVVQRDQRNHYRTRLYQPQDCPPDFVYIPQGSFQMGGDPLTASAGRVEYPFVPDIWVARFPVTIREYIDFLNAHIPPEQAHRHGPRRSPDGGYYLLWEEHKNQWVLPERDEDGDEWNPQWPVFAISWYDAQAYADWKAQTTHSPIRLPLAMELEKAARGVDGRFYPWGDHFDATFCKMGKSRPGPPKPEPIGAYPHDISVYGVQDLAGGIREWCSDQMEPADGAYAFGGNWSGSELTSRAAHRWFLQKGQVAPGIGMRLAMNASSMPYHQGFDTNPTPTISSPPERIVISASPPTPAHHLPHAPMMERLVATEFWHHLAVQDHESSLLWLAQTARLSGALWAMIQSPQEDMALAIAGDAPEPLNPALLSAWLSTTPEAQEVSPHPSPISAPSPPSKDPRYVIYPCGSEPLGYLILPADTPFSPETWQPLCTAITVVLRQRQDQSLARQREQQAHTEATQARQQLTLVREALATVIPDTYWREAYPLLDGQSRAMRKLYRMLDRVSQSDINVLIRGESGVGKERVALSIHQRSPYANGPFVPINCGAIPEHLVESELFGHVKGAFTGADSDHIGLFRQAEHGTLFLDEIAELSLEAQVKLLRTLQNRTVRPVGSTQEFPCKTRILAATHKDLKQCVLDGSFREDLYWRLVVVELDIPPLRERPEDIPTLVSQILSQHQPHKEISEQAVELLQRYPWPGNIRELENELKRAILVSEDKLLPSSFSRKLRESTHAATTSLHGPLRDLVAQVESDAIRLVLQQTHGNKAETGRILGLSKRGLQLKIERYKLDGY